MKLVIQRVSSAEVSVAGETAGKIGKGLFILLGVSNEDSEKEAEQVAGKVLKLRIMQDDPPSPSATEGRGKMNLSIMDTTKNILVVSQFTLFADTSKGNRPSFIKAGSPDHAKKLYEFFVEKLRDAGMNVETGRFGEYMDIDAKLDGPVTITLDEHK